VIVQHLDLETETGADLVAHESPGLGRGLRALEKTSRGLALDLRERPPCHAHKTIVDPLDAPLRVGENDGIVRPLRDEGEGARLGFLKTELGPLFGETDGEPLEVAVRHLLRLEELQQIERGIVDGEIGEGDPELVELFGVLHPRRAEHHG
jgi:hypothetical protein